MNFNMNMDAYLDKLNINKRDNKKTFGKKKSTSKADIYNFANNKQKIQYGDLR